MVPKPDQIWSHSTCTVKELQTALDDPNITAIESDIVMGRIIVSTPTPTSTSSSSSSSLSEVQQQQQLQPIMAHPPETTSDLSFRKFIQLSKKVVVAVKNSSDDNSNGKQQTSLVTLKKHLKLDIKDMECVEPVIQILQEELFSSSSTSSSTTAATTCTTTASQPQEQVEGEDIKQTTIYFNADILPGPGNRSSTPIKGDYFIETCMEYIEKQQQQQQQQQKSLPIRYSFSLGWTVDPRALYGYTTTDIGNMTQIINKHLSLTKGRLCGGGVGIVLAVSARVLYKNIRAFDDFLLNQHPSSQILIWTATGEPPISTTIYKTIQKHYESIGCIDRIGFDCKIASNPFYGHIYDTAVKISAIWFNTNKVFWRIIESLLEKNYNLTTDHRIDEQANTSITSTSNGMDLKSLIKLQSNKLKPTATVLRTSTSIKVEKGEYLSEAQKTKRISDSLEAEKERKEQQQKQDGDINIKIDLPTFEKMTQTQQLVAMGKAMGGPRFPNFHLRPYQKSDNIEEFEPLLEAYLNSGGTVNDTASFQDYFGQDIGLEDWSLLHVAACAFVNAPKCMRLLLEKGANPLQKDTSSGRHVLMEALATARHGYSGPWNVLQEYFTLDDDDDDKDEAEEGDCDNNSQSMILSPPKIKIRSCDVMAAKLADVTEAMILNLRRGKMDITPHQTQLDVNRFWRDGFHLYSKYYSPNEIHDHFHEMILISYDDLETMGYIPSREEGNRTSLSELLLSRQPQDTKDDKDISDGESKKIIFFSHRWLRPKQSHPDDDNQTKYSAMVKACQLYCQKLNVSKCNLYLWIDYSCIDQTIPNIKIRSIQSLPFYIIMADAFIAIDHKDYLTRAWCILEILFGSAMPIKTKEYVFCKYKQQQDDDDTSDADSSVGILAELEPIQMKTTKLISPDNSTGNVRSYSRTTTDAVDPRNGGVTDPNDMHYIRSLTWFAQDLYKWL